MPDLIFAKTFAIEIRSKFLNNHVAIYVDAKGFQYKTQPLDQARAPSAREWSKRNEGLNFAQPRVAKKTV